MVISISPTELRSPQGGRGNLIDSPTAPVHEVNTFFFWASVLLVLAVGASWLLLFGYTAMLKTDIAALAEQQQEITAQRSPKTERELRAIVERIKALPPLLKEHTDAERALVMLDELVQPGVLFSSPNVSFSQNTIQLSIAAPSVDAVAQQIVAFEDDERISHIAIQPLNRAETRPPFEGSFYETTATITLNAGAFLAVLSE